MSEQEFRPLDLSIPNEAGWQKKTLDELCSLISRGTAPVYVESSSVLAIGQRCVTSSRFAPEFTRPHAERAMRNVLCTEQGDVLLNSTGTGTIGRSVVFDNDGAFIVDGHVTVLRPKIEAADGRWLNAVLRTSWGQGHLERFCYAGSTNQLELSRKSVKASMLPVPTVQEQRGIAQVLDTLDTAILETEALIDKLKAVKQGLLHDLLTRGIDANGQLRPPQSEAPELYKESSLGWIPREWEILPLGSCAGITSGVTLGRSLSGSGAIELPYLRVANVQDGYLDLREIKTVPILPAELTRFSLKVGDVLMNEGGDFDKLGRGAIWEGQIEPCLHQNHVFRVRCDDSKLLPTFLAAYSGSARGKSYFVHASKQTTNLASINSTQLKAFEITCPSISEQKIITHSLSAFDEKVKAEQCEQAKLYSLKLSLMDDLLTGRVRVTPLLESMQQAAASIVQQPVGQMGA